MTHSDEEVHPKEQQRQHDDSVESPTLPFASSIENVLHANQHQIEQLRTLIEANSTLSLKEKVQVWAQLANSGKEEHLDALAQEIHHLKESLHSMQIEQNRLQHELHLATQPPCPQENVDSGKKEDDDADEPPRMLPKLQFYIRRVEELSMEASKWETLFYDAAEVGERRIERLEHQVKDLQEKLEFEQSKTATNPSGNEVAHESTNSLEKTVQEKDELIRELQVQIKSLQSGTAMLSGCPDTKEEREGEKGKEEDDLHQAPLPPITRILCKNESDSSTQNTSLDDEDPSLEPQDDSHDSTIHMSGTLSSSSSSSSDEEARPVVGGTDALDYVRELEVQFMSRMNRQTEVFLKNEEKDNIPSEEQETVDATRSCSTQTPEEQEGVQSYDEEERSFADGEVQQMLLDLEEEKYHVQETLRSSQERVWDLEQQLETSQQEVRKLQKQQQEQQYINTQNEKKKDISWEIDRKSLEKLVILQKRALLDAKATLETTRAQQPSEKEWLRQQQHQQPTSPKKETKWRFSLLSPARSQSVLPEDTEPKEHDSKDKKDQQQHQEQPASAAVNEDVTAALLLRNNLEVEKALRQSLELEMTRLESQLADTQQALEALQEQLEQERSSHVAERNHLQEEITCLRGSNEYHKESLEVLKEALREVSLELAASRKSGDDEQ